MKSTGPWPPIASEAYDPERSLAEPKSRIAVSPDFLLANAVCCSGASLVDAADAIRSIEASGFITLLGGAATAVARAL